MTAKETIEKRLGKLAQAIGSDDRLIENVMNHIDTKSMGESERIEKLSTKLIERRFTMSRLMKLAAAAVIIVAVALSITVVDKLASPAYAIEQTVEALKNVRFMHIVKRDDAGQIEDERWIEIGMDGWQVRYRQDSPPKPVAIEDGESTAVYRHDKQAVIIYDRKDMQYQWVGELGKALENLRQEGEIIKENDDYRGLPAHKVWWPYMSAECYVDPETKLPIVIGDTELSYEQPAAGTFDIVIPEGYAVLDKRPGAVAGPVPDWLQEEESIQEKARECFRQATHALARGDYAEAAELFEFVVEHQSGRNWAWFWLGSAYYELGEYDLAIQKFSKVLGMTGNIPYCNYARGLAYGQKGMDDAAREDLAKALPWMVRALRTPSAATMFEYADNPLMRYGKYKPTEREIMIHMINRLRLITGQNFGYDPDAGAGENEQAIVAWEDWFENSGQIEFAPEAELLLIAEVSRISVIK